MTSGTEEGGVMQSAPRMVTDYAELAAVETTADGDEWRTFCFAMHDRTMGVSFMWEADANQQLPFADLPDDGGKPTEREVLEAIARLFFATVVPAKLQPGEKP